MSGLAISQAIVNLLQACGRSPANADLALDYRPGGAAALTGRGGNDIGIAPISGWTSGARASGSRQGRAGASAGPEGCPSRSC
jgi:hypothetical protein